VHNLSKKTAVIACAVLALDLKNCAETSGVEFDYTFLEAGLHNNPYKLREKLQAAIDTISASGLYDRIIVGYGICGKGAVGIRAQNIPLVFPRVHDCIALFLGGNLVYRAQFKKYPGTFYLTKGWIEAKTESGSPIDRHAYFGSQRFEFNDLVEKHGEQVAIKTFDFLNTWQKNYQRAVYIETESRASSNYEEMAQKMAGLFHWQYEKIKGSHELIKKLIEADSPNNEILFVPSGYATVFDPIRMSLDASPVTRLTGEEANNIYTLDIDTPADESNAYIQIGLGIDAGGTYTDAVVYDLEKNLTICKAKALTTRWDFTVGIRKAMEGLDQTCLNKIELVALSTTLATNAIVENEGQKVGLILMPPYGHDVTKNISYHPKAIIQGQLEISGREITPINPDEVKAIAAQMIEKHHVTAFAVSGYAGAVNPEHELNVKKIIQDETGLFVSCGHELSDTLNFQTRAVTAMLNARIIPRLASLLLDLEKVLDDYGIKVPVVVVKGDGTLMSAGMAKMRPVETILSGPAASVAGARHLTGLDDAMVVDMGGTTTDTAAISRGMVSLNDQGSNVGGHRTHVKALDIRTSGLGGDSLILHEKGRFYIGPKRVAPIAWLGQYYPGTGAALDFIKDNLKHFSRTTMTMQIIAKTGDKKDLPLNPIEEKILTLLEQRPYSIDELVPLTGVLSEWTLPLHRLEERFIIQRCGLTLTDLLHIDGRFQKWDAEPSKRYAGFYSILTGIPLPGIIDLLMDMGVKKLALELLKHRLDDVDPDDLDKSPACKTLINHLLGGQHPNYEVAINLKHPVIGIGAPIGFFLPKAVTHFKTEAIIPEHADVANAIGAITSHVFIHKQLGIIPDEFKGFIVEGVSGICQFSAFDEADRFARQKLTEMVRKLALEAGTSARKITFETKDHMPIIATGDPVFVKRTISATLKGRPDLVTNKKF
jgi:N-methylhydantoinase A/oxoprolinase/acetone carboxylase beta subunit